MNALRAAVIGIAAAAGLAAGGCRPASQADLPLFPDLSKYTAANPQDYEIPFATPGHPPVPMFYFRTPDGISCKFTSAPAAAGCTGNNFPGIPPAAVDPSEGVNSIRTDVGLRRTSTPIAAANGPAFKTLPPFHTLTLEGVICGVDDAQTTACKDPHGRAFVLSPRGAGWLQL
ncbi:hypothetical protein [Mycobacterium camsae]|uniref:hypothetical protein n=1 Tax=Mycobacterium gordonae TaxID=1778 RepID=UPI00197F93F7|nr:hypothetical protein [Mycobacterium gordonae]